MAAVEKWRSALEALAVPRHILEAAPNSPWQLPVEPFRRRAEAALAGDTSPSLQKALEALPEAGVVIDVGVGAGAASLPLHPRTSLIVGVDASEEMLNEFKAIAEKVGAKVETIAGAWQDVHDSAPQADVVVCHHVIYNVADLTVFIPALTRHAGRRVVLEMTREHPWAWAADLWMHFYGHRWPPEPTADDAEAALMEMGLQVGRLDHESPRRSGAESREAVVANIRRRLCLPADRDPEIVRVLGDRLAKFDGGWSAAPTFQKSTTLWWDIARD